MEQCFNHDNSYNISVKLKHQNFAGEDFNKIVGLEEDGFQLCKSSSNNYFWRHRKVGTFPFTTPTFYIFVLIISRLRRCKRERKRRRMKYRQTINFLSAY